MEVAATLRISRDTHAKLVALARADVRTLAGEVEYIVNQYINTNPATLTPSWWRG